MDRQQSDNASSISSLSSAQQDTNITKSKHFSTQSADEVSSQSSLIEDLEFTAMKNNGAMDTCAVVDEDGNYRIQLSKEFRDLSEKSDVTVATERSAEDYSNAEDIREVQPVIVINTLEYGVSLDSGTEDSACESKENLSLINCTKTPTTTEDSARECRENLLLINCTETPTTTKDSARECKENLALINCTETPTTTENSACESDEKFSLINCTETPTTTEDSARESDKNFSLINCTETPTTTEDSACESDENHCIQTTTSTSDASMSPSTILNNYEEDEPNYSTADIDFKPTIFPTLDYKCEGLILSSTNCNTSTPLLEINDGILSPLYQENEFALSNQTFYSRRSSSLKAKKTPPNTPSSKKEVRFADAFGLDLASVRTVFNLDSPPQIPPQAMWDLPLRDALMNKDPFIDENQSETSAPPTALRFVQATFLQPVSTPKFHQRVVDQCVCLENAIVENTTVQGTVCVKNISFKKHVIIRYSVDEWTTFTEAPASYIQGSCNQQTDRFSFTLSLPDRVFVVGSRLQFCISYETNDNIYWDNNYGQNYSFVCYARLPNDAAKNADSCSWTHFL